MGYLLGKGSVLASADEASQAAWAENDHVVVPFVSDTLGISLGESTVTLCLFAWCQAVLEAEFFVGGRGDCVGTDTGDNALVEASKHAFRRWDARLT